MVSPSIHCVALAYTHASCVGFDLCTVVVTSITTLEHACRRVHLDHHCGTASQDGSCQAGQSRWYDSLSLHQARRPADEAPNRSSLPTFYLVLGIGYPAVILVTIVVTANRYFADALIRACFVCVALWCNGLPCVLLPLEDLLPWLVRVEKPVPTTGERLRERGGGT
ncbi:hypothetical protein BJ546DRAFT_406762 [Cryomyces antarcticus]